MLIKRHRKAKRFLFIFLADVHKFTPKIQQKLIPEWGMVQRSFSKKKLEDWTQKPAVVVNVYEQLAPACLVRKTQLKLVIYTITDFFLLSSQTFFMTSAQIWNGEFTWYPLFVSSKLISNIHVYIKTWICSLKSSLIYMLSLYVVYKVLWSFSTTLNVCRLSLWETQQEPLVKLLPSHSG